MRRTGQTVIQRPELPDTRENVHVDSAAALGDIGGMEANTWASEAVRKLLAQAVALIELDARAVAGLL